MHISEAPAEVSFDPVVPQNAPGRPSLVDEGKSLQGAKSQNRHGYPEIVFCRLARPALIISKCLALPRRRFYEVLV